MSGFAALDLGHLPPLRNCGRATIGYLAAVQERCTGGCERRTNRPPPSRKMEESPATTICHGGWPPAVRRPWDSWQVLPLFSGRHLAPLTAGELHPSYCPATPIESLAPSRSAREARAKADIRTLGELLLTLPGRLLSSRGFGRSRLSNLRSAVAGFLTASLAESVGRRRSAMKLQTASLSRLPPWRRTISGRGTSCCSGSAGEANHER